MRVFALLANSTHCGAHARQQRDVQRRHAQQFLVQLLRRYPHEAGLPLPCLWRAAPFTHCEQQQRQARQLANVALCREHERLAVVWKHCDSKFLFQLAAQRCLRRFATLYLTAWELEPQRVVFVLNGSLTQQHVPRGIYQRGRCDPQHVSCSTAQGLLRGRHRGRMRCRTAAPAFRVRRQRSRSRLGKEAPCTAARARPRLSGAS